MHHVGLLPTLFLVEYGLNFAHDVPLKAHSGSCPVDHMALVGA